jgi:hypothetical protein
MFTTQPPSIPAHTLAVDPGKRACGAALYYGGELLRAAAVRGYRTGGGPEVWKFLGVGVAAWVGEVVVGRLVVERMHHYTGSQVDADDLLELAGVSGAVVASLPRWRAEYVFASDWNGQVPGPVRRERTQTWVAAQGWSARVDLNTTQRHQEDVWSAIGIGRWAVTGKR